MSYLLFVVALAMNPVGYNVYELPKLWVLAFFVFLGCLGLLAKGKVSLPISKWVWALLGGWSVSVVASTVFSTAPWISFYGDGLRYQGLLSQILYIFVFFISLTYFASAEARRKLYSVTLWGVMIVSGYALLQSLGIDLYLAASVADFKGRVFSSFGHPNLLGQFLVFPFWIAVYQWWREKSVKSAIMLAVIVWVLILTGNRASWLGVGIGVLVYLTRNVAMRKWWAVWGGGAGVFSLLILFTRPAFSSFLFRWEVWKATLGLLPRAGFFGFGLDRFTQAFESVIPAAMYNYEYVYVVVDRAHQFFLDLFVAQGVLGVVVMAAVVMGVARVVLRRWVTMDNEGLNHCAEEQWLVVLSLLGLFVSLQFGFVGVGHGVELGLLLGLFVVLFFEKNRVLHISIPRVVVLPLVSLVVFLLLTVVLVGDSFLAVGELQVGLGGVQKGFLNVKFASLINPRQEYIYTQLGDMLYALGLESNDKEILTASLGVFDRAAEVKGKDFRYYFEKARVFAALGKKDEAEDFFLLAENKSANKVVLYEEWAKARFDEGDMNGARALLEKYFNLLPSVHRKVGAIGSLSKTEQQRLRLLLKNTGYFEMRVLWNKTTSF